MIAQAIVNIWRFLLSLLHLLGVLWVAHSCGAAWPPRSWIERVSAHSIATLVLEPDRTAWLALTRMATPRADDAQCRRCCGERRAKCNTDKVAWDARLYWQCEAWMKCVSAMLT